MNIPEQAARSQKGKTIVRIGLLVAALATAWHIFASFLWISPVSELRTVVPGNALSSYMIPWYGQSWSVFAPAPINGDYKLEVRAIVRDGADEKGAPRAKATGWVDATAVDLSMSRYNLLPPRASNLSTQQATKMLNAWKALNPEQQKIAELGFYEGDSWLGRMQQAMVEHGNESQANDYIVQERYTSAYATQVAYAIWGEDQVTQVQFQVSRQNIIPFQDRHNPDAERPAPETAPTGWRGVLSMPGQSNEDFRETFLKHYDGSTR